MYNYLIIERSERMKKELIKDNFYEAVNSSWLNKAEIPGDQPQMSAFLELHLDIEDTLLKLANDWNKDQTGLNDNLLKFIKVYQKANDFEARENNGTNEINSLLNLIDNLNSLKDLETNFKELDLSGISLPFGFSVMQDFLNSNNQVLYFGLSRLILPDTSYYQDEKTKEQLIGLWTQSTTDVLKEYGLSDKDIKKLITDTLKFDSLLVPVTKSSIEQADYVKNYNPLTKDKVNEKGLNINLINKAEELVNEDVDKLVFLNLEVLNKFNEIFNDDNFKIIKSWMTVNTYLSYTGEFHEKLRVLGGVFHRTLSGTKEAQNKEKAAFYKAYNYFNQIVGLYYGKNYFGEEAKIDVETMVYEMIDIYKQRIKLNDWLKEETKEKAIKKLNTLTVLVGFPDELPKYYDLMEVNDNDSLLNIKLKNSKLLTLDNYSKYNKEPNRNLWGMPASMVNAYYSPLNNQIVFPAAILQKPYYSKDQHVSANFGGIGAVIAHEISHAFDNNGAKFDEYGSLKDWWTKEDLVAFDSKQKEMIELFDGLETGYGKCNGTLTVSENIADSGGLRAALEASKLHKDHSYEEFFINWVKVWRKKAHDEYNKLLLTVDVHGPAILRANMQLSNLKEFQDYYKLTKEDKMYLDKNKMVTIW